MSGAEPRAAYRLDGAPASARAFYAAACDPARSVVIEACAGAGKTWMLVSRILRALVEGAQPHEILAITFTKKAAGEMRERLGQWLAEFSDPARCVAALTERGLDAARARELAPSLASLQSRVLDADRPVEIRTFHAWFSQLLRQAPLDLLDAQGLHPGVQLVEDTADLMPDLYRRFHARVDADSALRRDFAALVGSMGRSNLRKWLDAALSKRAEIELADAAGTLEPSVADAASLEPAVAGLDDPASALFADAGRLAMLLRVATALGRSTLATSRKQGAELERVLSTGADDPRQALDDAFASLFTARGTLRTKLAAPELDDAAEWLQRLCNAVLQHEAQGQHLRMVRLARVLFDEYGALKRSRSLADMPDLERLALELLRDSAAAGWMQQRLDARVRHLLIDEFQDTSPLQWQALQAWLASYAGAGGAAPSVLIVGDPKQSIYRFRRAEPRVFAAAREFVVQVLAGSVLECDHTRRNAPAVLAALNPVFEAVQRTGAYRGYRAHTSSVTDPHGTVQALAPVERETAAAPRDGAQWRDSLTQPRDRAEVARQQAEARQVARAIAARIAGGARAGGVMVLARRRETLRQLAAELQAAQLPHAAVEAQPLAESPEVRDLLALLDVLASPGHDLSLATVLKSPLFGAGDDDLQDLAEAAGGPGGWWAALMQPGRSAALEQARQVLAELASQVAVLPPHDLLDAAVHRTDARARLLQALPARRRSAALAAVDALLAQALTLDGGRYTSAYGFVRALRRRALALPMPADPDAVQLLTVHGAKGLEADTVHVMDCDPVARRADGCTLLVDWPVDAGAPRCCAFVAQESRIAPSLGALLAAEQAEREREELNSLYVAMTRARENLVFTRTVPARSPSPTSWWARLQAHVAPALPPEPAAGGMQAAEVPQPVAAMLELPAWTPADTGEAAPRDATADDPVAAALGSAVHKVLEWALARPGAAADAASRAELARSAARLEGVAPERAGEIAARVQAILSSPACRPFFPPSPLQWAGNEVAFSDAGELLRVDRLVAIESGKGRQWWVLDYKLNRDPLAQAAYREQMRRYRGVVARANPGDEVRCAFITGAGERVDVEFGD